MSMGSVLRSSVVTAAVVVAMPAAAFGVSVSSGEGQGWQTVATKYSNGASTNGELRSINGNPVYYRGLVDWKQLTCSDSDVGRYTSNTTSMNNVGRNGLIATASGAFCSSQGVKSRVCRDVSLLPDPCGPWSSRF